MIRITVEYSAEYLGSIINTIYIIEDRSKYEWDHEKLWMDTIDEGTFYIPIASIFRVQVEEIKEQ